MALCPGKDAFLKTASDLTDDTFRRLVSRRARQVVDPGLPTATTKRERKAQEAQIEAYFEKVHKGADFLPARFLGDGAAPRPGCL